MRPTTTDSRLRRDVMDRLLRHPIVGAQPVTVDARRGVVVLGGTVDSPAARDEATRAARQTPGARDVCTLVTVAAPHDRAEGGTVGRGPTTDIWVAVAVGTVGVMAAIVIVVTGWVAVLVVACAVTAVSVEVALNRHHRRMAAGQGPCCASDHRYTRPAF